MKEARIKEKAASLKDERVERLREPAFTAKEAIAKPREGSTTIMRESSLLALTIENGFPDAAPPRQENKETLNSKYKRAITSPLKPRGDWQVKDGIIIAAKREKAKEK